MHNPDVVLPPASALALWRRIINALAPGVAHPEMLQGGFLALVLLQGSEPRATQALAAGVLPPLVAALRRGWRPAVGIIAALTGACPSAAAAAYTGGAFEALLSHLQLLLSPMQVRACVVLVFAGGCWLWR